MTLSARWSVAALAATITTSAINVAQAALPPEYQNQKDLNVMVDVIFQHEEIIGSLKRIDMQRHIVYYGYGEDCELHFTREDVYHPPGWVGPADPLVVDYSTCAGFAKQP